MPRSLILNIFSILLTLLLRITTAIQPAIVPKKGYAEGYYGNLPKCPTGDYLLATNCMCERAAPLLSVDPDIGSYVQYEYYNFHVKVNLELSN